MGFDGDDVGQLGRLVVSRGESAAGSWEFVRGAVGPQLAGVVMEVCGYRERATGVLRRRFPAAGMVPVILSFGDRLDIVEMPDGDGVDGYESFVAGFHPGYAVAEFQGGQFGLQLNLTPLGAFQVFGVPGAELSRRVVHLEDVAPTLAGSLPDQLASLPTWEERFELVGRLVISLLDGRSEPDPLVRWMWTQIQASGGRIRVSELVEESGWSHRYVTSRFRQQVGLTPKSAAAVVRFERAAAVISTGEASLSDVAARCGYADQSHLTREFVRLAGTTPTVFGDPAVPLPDTT